MTFLTNGECLDFYLGAKDAAEFADAFADLGFAEAGEAKDQAGAMAAANVVAGDAVDSDAAFSGAGDDIGLIDAAPRPEHDVRAGALSRDFDFFSKDGL